MITGCRKIAVTHNNASNTINMNINNTVMTYNWSSIYYSLFGHFTVYIEREQGTLLYIVGPTLFRTQSQTAEKP